LLCSILVLAGSKRSSESPGNCVKDLGICLSVSSASATPASSPSQGGSAVAGGSGSGSGGAGGSGSGGAGLEGAGGSGAAIASDIRAAGASDLGAAVASDIGATGASDRGFVAAGTSTASAISVDGDEPVQEGDVPCGKRHKRCTSNVWQYFTKNRVVIEDNGKAYVQLWVIAIGPNAITRVDVRATMEQLDFWTHLRVAHSIVKGQQQLKVEKMGGKT